jgi:hypothetical protein
MNTTNLIRWAGLAALVAGTCFVVRELLDPPELLASVTTSRWAVAHGLAMAMSLFGLLGVTGIYTRQAAAAGWLGLAGYLLLSGWLVISFAINLFEAFILPSLVTEAPTFAEGYLLIITRSPGASALGGVASLWNLADILFMLGSLVFGIATLRANILSRWAAGLFTVGIAVAPAYGLLPTVLQPLVAVPIGLGLAWLGFAVWSERRALASQPIAGRGKAQLSQTGAP